MTIKGTHAELNSDLGVRHTGLGVSGVIGYPTPDTHRDAVYYLASGTLKRRPNIALKVSLLKTRDRASLILRLR